MTRPVIPRKGDYEGLYFIRWVLMLVVASRAAGMRELNRERLHALLFQSFASSLFYGLRPLRQRARRTPHGPYYRAAHIAVGRLVLSGLATLDDYDPLDQVHGLQFDGRLAPSAQGLEVVDVLRQTGRGEQIYRFLLDLCLSMVEAVTPDVSQFAAANGPVASEAESAVAAEAMEASAQHSIDRILHTDLSYQQALSDDQPILAVFRAPDDVPLTVRGLRDVQGAMDDGLMRNRRDILTAYQHLLRRRVA